MTLRSVVWMLALACGLGCAQIVQTTAAIASRALLGTVASRFRMTWTRHRCHVAPPKDRGDRWRQARVGIGGDQSHAAEAALHETAEERRPDGAIRRWADVDRAHPRVPGPHSIAIPVPVRSGVRSCRSAPIRPATAVSIRAWESTRIPTRSTSPSCSSRSLPTNADRSILGFAIASTPPCRPSPARENSRKDARWRLPLSTPPGFSSFHHVRGL